MQGAHHEMHHLSRLTIAGGAAVVALVLLLAGPAAAHVSVNPNEAPKGGFTKLSFRVPNEGTVPTTQVEIAFPPDAPITSVNTRPVAGWTVNVERVVTTDAVARITWSGGSIGPGEFQEFDVSLGPLPDTVDRLVFKALQTYADGEIVRWIDDPPAAGADEPEHPAPVLTLTAGDEEKEEAKADDTVAPPDVDDDHPVARAALVLSALALAVGAVALLRTRAR